MRVIRVRERGMLYQWLNIATATPHFGDDDGK
jgi:hypothetical protein